MAKYKIKTHSGAKRRFYVSGGVDARYPQATEVALAVAPVLVGVLERVHDRFIGLFEQAVPPGAVPFGLRDYFLAAPPGDGATPCSWQRALSYVR